ncbi:hypothetical protein M0R04_12755 [Candidatus Dojkabacteria bacterium]|jgi:hypothetical protein|nr:hypothetical protein [Candidatus Dojkabacteria bacterium]
MNINAETQKIITEGEELKQMVNSEGWRIARQKLGAKVASLSDILLIEDVDPNKLMLQLAANQQAIKILITWLKEIEGEVIKVEEIKASFRQISEDHYIHILEGH